MNPTDHQLTPKGSPVEMVCASFEFGAGLNNPLARAFPEVICLALENMPSLETTLAVMFKESSHNYCGRQAVLDRLMEVVFIQVLRNLMDENLIELGLLAGLSDHRLCKAINAMHSDPAKAWSLEQLAGKAGMSRAHFATRFREVVGIPPFSYLSEWRLSIAQSLLNKGKAVQLIADSVGYASASALSRAFKAQLGQTPSEWLRTHDA